MKTLLLAAIVALLPTEPSVAATPPSSSAACRDPAIRYVDRAEVRIAYAVDGDGHGHPVILLGGIDQQLTDWPASLVEGLIKRGFRVIRYDARDIGCSTHLTNAAPIDWPSLFVAVASGSRSSLPYHAADLSDDLLGLMDALDLPSAILLGASGGSSIASLTAVRAPARVDGLILLMANSGNRQHPLPANPARLASVPPAPPAAAPLRDIIAYRVAAAEALEGSAIARARHEIETWAAAASARSYNAGGTPRTGAALLALGDMRPQLASVRAPTIVIHGSEDPLIPAASGRDVAEAIPGARFILIEGMGHSLPERGVERVLTEIEGMNGTAPNRARQTP